MLTMKALVSLVVLGVAIVVGTIVFGGQRDDGDVVAVVPMDQRSAVHGPGMIGPGWVLRACVGASQVDLRWGEPVDVVVGSSACGEGGVSAGLVASSGGASPLAEVRM